MWVMSIRRSQICMYIHTLSESCAFSDMPVGVPSVDAC